MKLHKGTKCVMFYIVSTLFNVSGPALNQLQDSTGKKKMFWVVCATKKAPHYSLPRQTQNESP